MKKLLLAAATLMLCACGSSTPSSSNVEQAKGTYQFVNKTGEKVTELYVYLTGSSDKGTNYAEAGLAAEGEVTATYSVDADKVSETALTVEFVTESGYAGAPFTTLAIEEAVIHLLSQADATSGSTQQSIHFFVEGEQVIKTVPGTYKFVNKTGEKLVELYVYETGSAEKGDNIAGSGLEVDGDATVIFEVAADAAETTMLTIEFKTESGYAGTPFTTLAIEEAEIEILAQADVVAGATAIKFVVPGAE